TGKERGCHVAAEPQARRRGALLHHTQGEAGEQREVTWTEPARYALQITQTESCELLPAATEPAQQTFPGGTVDTETSRCGGQGSVGDPGPSAGQGLGIGHLGGAELDAERLQVQLAEERRGGGHRMHRGADVVDDAGREAQIEGPGTTAWCLLSLENRDRHAGARDRH